MGRWGDGLYKLEASDQIPIVHSVNVYVIVFRNKYCLNQTIEMHRNIFKNLLLQNHLAQMFQIWYVALPSGPLPSCSNEGPRVQDDLWSVVVGLNHRNA